MFNSVAVTCRYKIPPQLVSGGSDDKLKAIFSYAVAETVIAHPHLQVGIDDEQSKNPRWKCLSTLRMENHVEWIELSGRDAEESLDDVLLRVIEKQHDTRWPNLDERPGWKFTNRQTRDGRYLDVIFAWHHSYGDGTSGKIVHRTLLNSLRKLVCSNNIDTSEALAVLDLPKNAVLPPIVSDVVKFTFSILYTVRTVWVELLCPSFLATAPPKHLPWEGGPITLTPYKTSMRYFEIENKTSYAVLEKCRGNKTTLTSLIHALILASLSRRVSPEDARAFTSCTPISLRRYINATAGHSGPIDPENILGDFVTSANHHFGPDDVDRLRSQVDSTQKADFIWDVARRVRSELLEKTEELPANDTVGLLRLVGDWKAWFREQASKRREKTWEVSNLGVMTSTPVEDEDIWRIERAVFSQGALVAGAGICVNVLTVNGKSLSITCTWQECIVDAGTVDGLVSDLQLWLGNLGNEEPFHL